MCADRDGAYLLVCETGELDATSLVVCPAMREQVESEPPLEELRIFGVVGVEVRWV